MNICLYRLKKKLLQLKKKTWTRGVTDASNEADRNMKTTCAQDGGSSTEKTTAADTEVATSRNVCGFGVSTPVNRAAPNDDGNVTNSSEYSKAEDECEESTPSRRPYPIHAESSSSFSRSMYPNLLPQLQKEGLARSCSNMRLLRISSNPLLSKESQLLANKGNQNAFEEYKKEAKAALVELHTSWGVPTTHFNTDPTTPATRSVLGDKSEVVIVMEGWNKVLAFRSMFAEAIVGRWRMLTAMSKLREDSRECTQKTDRGLLQRSLSQVFSDIGGQRSMVIGSTRSKQALSLVEQNRDPLAVCLGSKIGELETLVIGLLDVSVRDLCPHIQIVQREAYRPLAGSADPDPRISRVFLHNSECKTFDDYCHFFALYGLKPSYWIDMCCAFLWAIKTHSPYAKEQDEEDLDKDADEGAFSKFVASMVALPMIEMSLKVQMEMSRGVYTHLKVIWDDLSPDEKAIFGERAFQNLFATYPELVDFFSEADMDSTSLDLVDMIGEVINRPDLIGKSNTELQYCLGEQGDKYRKLSLPTYAHALIGAEVLENFKPHFVNYGGEHHWDISATELELAFVNLYQAAMAIFIRPSMVEDKLKADAEEFFKEVASELNWSHEELRNRLIAVNMEIAATGTYTHTTQEVEIGARLAWRNSAKCIGRISWNTLKVQDCRYIKTPDLMFKKVKEHLRLATAGTNIQSVMTVFRPKQPGEIWGTRFWSSQYVRYAGYKNKITGDIIGDSANADFTEYLIRHRLWCPPEERTAHDVLPLVIKIPKINKPFVYNLPKEFVHEINIEHPSCPAIGKLGNKWAAIPAISNFKMNLGGIDYPCCPFNGWFASIEISRNLVERYNAVGTWSEAMCLNRTDRLIKQKISLEVETAVLYSYEKAKFTIVDSDTVGNQFVMHCKRERDAGRECPAQWSWIGGLVGPTNPTWHVEMRDFYVAPQYNYCCDPWKVLEVTDDEGVNLEQPINGNTLFQDELSGKSTSLNSYGKDELSFSIDASVGDAPSLSFHGSLNTKFAKKYLPIPQVLIAFASETGTAEMAAYSLARRLKVCNPVVSPLNDIAGLDIISDKRISHLLVLCSTFGKGEPPANGLQFFETTITSTALKRTRIAVLALGSKLYPDFCRAGILLEKKLIDEGGAQSLAKLTCVDETNGSQLSISQWSSMIGKLVLPSPLASQLELARGCKPDTPLLHKVKWKNSSMDSSIHVHNYRWNDDTAMVCKGNHELITGGNISTRSTRCLKFELPHKITYETGDHLLVYPKNSISIVKRFCNCFAYELQIANSENDAYLSAHDDGLGKISADDVCNMAIVHQMQQPFSIIGEERGELFPAKPSFPTPISLFEALQAHLDLALRESYLSDLLSFLLARLEMVKEMPTYEKVVEFQNLAQNVLQGDQTEAAYHSKVFISLYPTIVDLMEAFCSIFCEPNSTMVNASALISFADIMVHLPRLRPRFYSISSSAISSPEEVSITVGVVHDQTGHGVTVHGVCSNYLARLVRGDWVRATVRKSTFRGPKSMESPIVMVGAGTGLAPLMGFLEDRSLSLASRENSVKVGPCHLIFGCRSHNEQLYNEKISLFESDNILKLHLALSRDAYAPKTYVQDKLIELGAELCELLLREDTYYFICGDAKMADSCYEACIEVLKMYGKLSRVAAVQRLIKMRLQNRWQYDLWGITYPFSSNGFLRSEVKKRGRKSREAASAWMDRYSRNSLGDKGSEILLR